jgi:hypothetical protein
MVSSFIGDGRIIRIDNAAAESMTSPRSEELSRRDQQGFDKPAVAGLTIGIISKMSRDELIRVIDGADLPLIDSRNRQRLRYLDRPSLQRLAQLARRCCRNQGY